MNNQITDHKAKPRTMTILELAETLNVTTRTITRYVAKLCPNELRHGSTTYLNENQVTAIKLDLEKNKHLDTSVTLPKTDLEKKLLVQQAMNILNEEIEELQNQLQDAQPKIEFHDQVGDSGGLYSIGETAKILGTGRNRLFDWLRDEGIFFNRQPYQSYIEQGYFKLKTLSYNKYVQSQAFTTPKGLLWLQRQRNL